MTPRSRRGIRPSRRSITTIEAWRHKMTDKRFGGRGQLRGAHIRLQRDRLTRHPFATSLRMRYKKLALFSGAPDNSDIATCRRDACAEGTVTTCMCVLVCTVSISVPGVWFSTTRTTVLFQPSLVFVNIVKSASCVAFVIIIVPLYICFLPLSACIVHPVPLGL